jgi:tetratricopeptide (TPR) repeat protein
MDTRNTLYAFYDFEVAPITFDFFVFLTLAEIQRQKLGLSDVKLILVPGNNDGYRELDISNSTSAKDWRVDNIILTGWRLVPTISGLTLCSDRDEAEMYQKDLAQHIFPTEYTVKNPVGDFTIVNYTFNMAMGESSPSLMAPYQSRASTLDWLKTIMPEPRDIITITIRYYKTQPERNSNLEAWAEFAKSLDPGRFLPVFIPETETLFTGKPEILNKFHSFDAAAIYTPLRMAIYDLAYLNLGVSNGPRELNYYSNNRYITYKIAVEDAPSARQKYLSSIAYPEGSKPGNAGPFQKWVWEEDTFEVIRNSFDEMVTEIDEVESGPPVPLQIRPPATTEERLALGIRMQEAGHLDRAEFIFENLMEEMPADSRVLHAIGRTAIQRGQGTEAADYFHRALENGGPSYELALDYSQSLFMAKLYAEAAHWAKEALTFEPNSTNTFEQLAECYLADGKFQEALEAFQCLLNIQPENYNAVVKTAEILFAANSRASAFVRFCNAFDLAPKNAPDKGLGLLDRLGRIFAEIGCASESLAAFLVANSMRANLSIDQKLIMSIRQRLVELSTSE